jgi:nitrogenase-associated protein
MRFVFYEKHGCMSNARQKAILRAAGHEELEVRDLLRQTWTTERLRAFFGECPVADWFKPTAARVKSGEVKPKLLDETAALALMVTDPCLIRRPLMETAAGLGVGFEGGSLLDALGVRLLSGEDLHASPKQGPDADREPRETIP